MKLRSGTIKQNRPIPSKGFHVKGRASAPLSDNVLVTDNVRKLKLGQKYGVIAINRRVRLHDMYDVSEGLKRTYNKTYLLVDYGPDHLYLSKAPLSLHGPRQNAAAPKKDPRFAGPPTSDMLEIEVEYDQPVTKGSEKPTRDAAMGGSALNYARFIFENADWVSERSWEWLHVVGHALGGNNEAGNLVAGSYDANTAMIPHEKAIGDATREGRFVTVKYEVALYPDSWVGIDVTMTYSWIGDGGFYFQKHNVPAQTDIRFDKLQYDLWLVDHSS